MRYSKSYGPLCKMACVKILRSQGIYPVYIMIAIWLISHVRMVGSGFPFDTTIVLSNNVPFFSSLDLGEMLPGESTTSVAVPFKHIWTLSVALASQEMSPPMLPYLSKLVCFRV